MKRIGLTGGIGCGKSTLVDYLIGQGMCVVDTDQLAREALSPGQPAYDTVMERLKGACRLEDGTLDRSALGHLVFNDDKKRRWLEGLLHPVIRQAWESRLHTWDREGCPMAVVVIPLLFETQAQDLFDHVICMACSEKEQLHRLLKRGWSQEHIQQRLKAQWSLKEKMDASDGVIWAEGPLSPTFQQWDQIYHRIVSP